ncbi:MAG: hypothetical protein K2X34_10785 [Hyphomonadaceae bacterium]|nr:hypothetical protein [Hyphomonadaceae bacterium]
MIIRTLFGLVVAIALVVAADAVACPPPPPGPPPEVGESAEAHAARVAEWQAARDAEHTAWRLAGQRRLWDEADSVIIARVERVRPDRLDYWGDTQRVTLRPLRIIKGRRYTNRFSLRYTDATSCGPIPGFDAIAGQVGDEFVVFLRGGRPRQSTVQGTVSIGAILDVRITEAIGAD